MIYGTDGPPINRVSIVGNGKYLPFGIALGPCLGHRVTHKISDRVKAAGSRS